MAEVVVNANDVIGAEQMDDYVFIIRTSQASAFRTLVEALKENLTEVNIEIDQTGMN